jgi:hypothetical protein
MSDKTSNLTRISEALQILDEAAVHETESIQEMLRNRYQNLKQAVIATERSFGESYSRTKDDVQAKAREVKD